MSTPTNGSREQPSLTRLIHDTIRTEQDRIAKLPAGLKVWNDEQGVAWQNGMSNASRIAREVAAHWLAAQELTPGAVSLMVETAAKAMFEDPAAIPAERYTWAEMVAEDPSRADLWRQDARRVLVFSGALHPRFLSAPDIVPRQAVPEDVLTRLRAVAEGGLVPNPGGGASIADDVAILLAAIAPADPPQAGPTPEQLAEALCDAMPHPGGGSRLDYEDALDAARKALAETPFSAGTPFSDALRKMTPTDTLTCTGRPKIGTHGAPKPPSDAQVLAALNAQVREDRRAPDLSYWGEQAADLMRAALAAAQGVDQ